MSKENLFIYNFLDVFKNTSEDRIVIISEKTNDNI